MLRSSLVRWPRLSTASRNRSASLGEERRRAQQTADRRRNEKKMREKNAKKNKTKKTRSGQQERVARVQSCFCRVQGSLCWRARVGARARVGDLEDLLVQELGGGVAH
eukprot:394820-Rhodomonas_salina.1